MKEERRKSPCNLLFRYLALNTYGWIVASVHRNIKYLQNGEYAPWWPKDLGQESGIPYLATCKQFEHDKILRKPEDYLVLST